MHKNDKRTNIPTAELGGFVDEAERRPKTVLYPRDPTLDPQLVWKGKDELDSHDLEVPSVPIYIQEKVAPQAIIEDLRTHQRESHTQPNLFADFNGIDFETLVDFYHHQQNWSNRLILGDSLLVMTSLAEKEGLKGQVQCIYVDPPYGIKFGSNWQVSTRTHDIRDGRIDDATRQPEQIRAFRDTWELGIHSYLTYLRDRLVACRELLSESGSTFVQIGEENVHLVRSLLDEVFGSRNFVSLITYSKTAGATSELLPGTADYILWYAKAREALKFRRLFTEKAIGGHGAAKYDQLELADGTRRPMTPEEKANAAALPIGARPYRLDNLTSQSVGRQKGEGAASWFPVSINGQTFNPTLRSRWKTNEQGMASLLHARRVQVTGNTLAYVRFVDDFPAYPITNTWMDIGGIQSRADPKIYVVQTANSAVERCILMSTDPGDIVLDPTCGSGTTAYVAEVCGRRWITVDTSRVALALARTRLMCARFPYYVLADSAEGVRLESELNGQIPPNPPPSTSGDVHRGFVHKRVPHVTLKSIANNPDIYEGMSREEIDKAIARHAESETLVDQPYEDKRIVRVTGPFTVESLSPHRVLEEDAAVPASERIAESLNGQFEQVVLDNLKTAGVQNTVKGERLMFEALEPWAGAYVQAAGEYRENGTTRRAAVAIGPEHGTVGPELIREAAKEAAHYFDVLVVCGFAFDARVGEEAKKLGRLTILKAAINPDLALGGDLLKKSRSANMFMVFGEPDIEVQPTAQDELIVEIRGVDIYDPTTGEIRSHSTDDIACWFIDTDYNEESFFVRHAYFLGAGDPYEQLKRALRAEINEEVWASLYSTVSRSFARPKTGKIAVKVINHYGDEVMKVYST